MKKEKEKKGMFHRDILFSVREKMRAQNRVELGEGDIFCIPGSFMLPKCTFGKVMVPKGAFVILALILRAN